MGLNPSGPPAKRAACKLISPVDGPFALPIGGTYVKARGTDPATLYVGRFGDRPAVEIGAAQPDAGWSWVLIPTDPAPERWLGQIATGEAIVCPVA